MACEGAAKSRRIVGATLGRGGNPAESVASWSVCFSHTSNAAAVLSGRTQGVQTWLGNLRRAVDAMGKGVALGRFGRCGRCGD